MMRTQVITGSKQEIAAQIANTPGEVREVILFIEDSDVAPPDKDGEDFLTEMEEHMVDAPDVDYSRESIYDRTIDE
jgi:hypothetical protein